MKKLKLNKQTVSLLNNQEKKTVIGGAPTETEIKCNNDTFLCSIATCIMGGDSCFSCRPMICA